MSVDDRPGTPQPPPMTPQEARAHVKAAKAYSKATRPLYKKKRVIVPSVLFVLIVMISIATAGGGGDPAVTADSGAAASDAGVEQPAAPAGPTFGTPIKGSKFTVTVTQVGECVGPPSCSFDLQYENTGAEKNDETVSGQDLVLVDKMNRQFESTTFDFVDLQPGQTKRVTYVFENLAADFAPQRLDVDTGGAQGEISFP
jgi:hypothetical protein